jgi:hypothetical protein
LAVHHAAQFGIVIGSVAVDLAKVRQRAMVEGLVALHLDLYRKSGAELILGDGRFMARKRWRSVCATEARASFGARVLLRPRQRGYDRP